MRDPNTVLNARTAFDLEHPYLNNSQFRVVVNLAFDAGVKAGRLEAKQQFLRDIERAVAEGHL